MQKFYMVYVDGATGSTHKHLTRELAEQEAKRLVGKTSGRAYVLESVIGFEPIANVQVISFD